MNDLLPEQECTRCGNVTEYYMFIETINKKTILCDECAKNCLLTAMARELVSQTFIVDFAERKLDI